MKKTAFTAALEQHDDTAQDEVVEITTADVEQGEIELANIEVKHEKVANELESAATEVCEDTEAAATEIVALESLLATVSEMSEDGMSPTAARLMQAALTPSQERYNAHSEYTTLSIECFSGRQATTSTNVSMEGIKEVIAKIIAWVKEKFAQFIAWVKRKFGEFRKDLNVLSDRVQKLKVATRRRTGRGVSPEGEVDLGRHADRIRWDDKVDPADISANMQRLGMLVNAPEGAYEAVLKNIRSAVGDNMLNGDKIDVESHLHIPAGWSKARVDSVGYFDSMVTYASPEFPGQRCVLMGISGGFRGHSAPSVGETTQTKKPLVFRVWRAPSIKALESTKVSYLSTEQIQKFCMDADGAINKLKGVMKAYEDYSKRISDALTDGLKRGEGSQHELKESAVMDAVNKINAVGNIYLTDLVQACSGPAYNVIASYCVWAEKSAAAIVAKEKSDSAAATA